MAQGPWPRPKVKPSPGLLCPNPRSPLCANWGNKTHGAGTHGDYLALQSFRVLQAQHRGGSRAAHRGALWPCDPPSPTYS